jgi:hypothetical protein
MILCFAFSGRGQRQRTVVERVPHIVDTSAHCVGLGGSGLMARVMGGAGHACVSNLDLMFVYPAVTLLVPGRFD